MSQGEEVMESLPDDSKGGKDYQVGTDERGATSVKLGTVDVLVP